MNRILNYEIHKEAQILNPYCARYNLLLSNDLLVRIVTMKNEYLIHEVFTQLLKRHWI